MDNLQIKIKGASELMHEACDEALDNFVESAEDHLSHMLDMSEEDWLDDEDTLAARVDEARELVNDAIKQRDYFLKEVDLHGLLNNGYRDSYDDKDAQDAIDDLKAKVSDYIDTIGGGMDDDETRDSLNNDIDDITYYYNYYKNLARAMQK